jgi:UDP-N-acetylmuramoyl-L-alanyl-D-glutamate--2,6-diaminopimelate ligase
MGIETAAIQEGWKNFTGVPGRMEPVPNTLGITILVDYAHTETSLRSVLETLKNNNQRMIVVFGATGDRDTTKRPKMGAVVHELADIIVLTDDDTYTEPSGRIIDMVKK